MYKTIITNKKQIGLQFHKAQSSNVMKYNFFYITSRPFCLQSVQHQFCQSAEHDNTKHPPIKTCSF